MIAIYFICRSDSSIAQHVNEKLIEQRVILVRRPNSETFRIDPSLTISDDDINRFITAFENAVSEIEKIC